MKLLENLRELVGHYRELLEIIRQEKEALVEADLKLIHELTQKKEYYLELVRLSENKRIELISNFFQGRRTAEPRRNLSELIKILQGEDLKTANDLSHLFATLGILIRRAKEQNDYVQQLLNKSIGHIENMKANVMGEATVKTATYGSKGVKQSAGVEPRFVSQEV